MKKKLFNTGMFIVMVVLLTVSGQALANNFVKGASSNANVNINTDAGWVIVRQVSINIPEADDNEHGCVATASADVDHSGPSGLESQYRFVLSRNTTTLPINSGSERSVSLIDNPGVNDRDFLSVATTQHFTGLTNTNGQGGTGLHTFYFLGRKVEAAAANTDVLDASLSVICVHAK